ncbi:calcineurin-like phosphoesterase C-terminal domain-containing protein [Sphingobacterium sp. SGL-16]|uniref:calcineurin-like phosphoesterase C-terminal domain-containing protein n=1 Tax=Sphingobacterium sp. SGL-16 TaxID=2710883 RepID=UPI0013ECACAD|nr:calcineurin-like phosphoesterase family protein [Sphingobacterium sp. SGL-16]NGM72818.1 Ser/Thr phosphatase [Sphingobacterium sp. SGL-16]
MIKSDLLKYIGLILGFSVLVNGYAQDLTSIHSIRGHVFLDKNKNGIVDKNERGLKNILISNGVDIVKTDSKGAYQIPLKKGQSLFPILPSNYKIAGRKSRYILNANYYYFHPDSTVNTNNPFNFLVHNKASSDKFRVGAIGDVQIDNEDELAYASKSIASELANAKDIDFNIFLGDLVNDKIKLLTPVKEMLENIPIPSWTLPGNHDRDFDKEYAMNHAFNTHFGADTYSFNYGKVHFIVLNNVFATGKRTYEGRITADQLQFIKNDLSHVDKKTTIVINQHIPMYGTRNREDFFQLLEGYENVLILSGHTHVVSRHIFKNGAIHEIGAGATCGTWWRGEKNSDGIPDALMQCGSPRGYFIIDFDQNNYSFKYKAVGIDESKQMRLTLDSNDIIANIFGGSDSTLVQYQINNGEWQMMKKTRKADPYVSSLVQNNKVKIYPTEGNTAIPLRERNSSHIWTAKKPNTNSQLPYTLRIKAYDKFGFSVEEQFVLFQ